MNNKFFALFALLFYSFCFFFSSQAHAEIPEELEIFLQKSDTTNLYWKLDEDPGFPGGESAFREYFVENLSYPVASQQNGVQGKVFVLFIIEKDGTFSAVQATNKYDGNLEKAAVELVRNMPKWNPGKVKGDIVRSLMILPVNFTLE
ncbi:energy transducer TonB [Marinilabilia salmonicolor]|uniref:energy transducer TonB n=1 Tax=Marinilabilia salmonicolor TaxID=989 RepID=UPI00029B5058|nr:energy transducer TonB [Marinilabilia salmonicolor]